MKNYITSITLFFTIATCANAQQEAQYTQYMLNNLQNNAGFTGARRVISVSALYRNQWVGFKGNPRSYFASIDMPLPSVNRLGVGMVLASQSEGIISRLALTPSVSYAIIHTEESTLRIGANASFRQYRFDLQNTSVNIQARQDPTLSETDRFSFNNMNIGMGIYYDKKNIYAGISIPNLNGNPLVLNQNAVKLTGKERQHLYAMIGGLFPIGDNKDLELKPSALLKYVANAPIGADISLNLWVKKKFMGGMGYRLNASGGNSVNFLGLTQLADNISVGVSYDFGLSTLAGYNRSSVEASLKFDFASSAKVMHNPRFFF